MSDMHGVDAEEQAARTKQVERATEPEYDAQGARATPETEEEPSYPGSLLRSPMLRGRGNGVVNATVMQNMQRAYGNRALQRMLGRNGAATSKGLSPETGIRVQREPAGVGTDSPAGASPEVESPPGDVSGDVSGDPIVGLKKGDGMKPGTEGLRPRVEDLQNRLRKTVAAIIDIDGKFGNETAGALSRFREGRSLPESDTVDEATASKLAEESKFRNIDVGSIRQKNIFVKILATQINGLQANGQRIKIVDGPGALVGDAFIANLEGIETSTEKDVTIKASFFGIIATTKGGRRINIADARALMTGNAIIRPNDGGDGQAFTMRMDFISVKGRTGSGAPFEITDGRGLLLGDAFISEPTSPPPNVEPPVLAPSAPNPAGAGGAGQGTTQNLGDEDESP